MASQGFRIYWRWRSACPGRPKTSAEIRALIRRMSRANPLWGAPRIHGELLKFGIEVSQATVGRHLPHRGNAPSPTWRTFLRNHMTAITAVKLLYAVIVPDRCVTERQRPARHLRLLCRATRQAAPMHRRADPRSKRGDAFAMIALHSLSIGIGGSSFSNVADEALDADSRLDPGIKDERTSAELAEATKVLRNDGKLALLGDRSATSRADRAYDPRRCLTAGRYH
jgi:hypothetical protein